MRARVLVFALLCSVAAAEGSSRTPEEILTKVSADGDRALSNLFQEDEERFYVVMDRIAEGSSRWLDVAVALAPGADAHPAEELENALSHSLVKAPAAVLKRSFGPFTLDGICRGPGLADSEQEYRAVLQAARQSVASVHDKKLKGAKTRCLAAIDEQLHKKDPVQ